MTLAEPYPAELIRIARNVVWYDTPERTLKDLKLFLSHLMVYGSPTDVEFVERYIPEDEFRKVLEEAPLGVFTLDAWKRWHHRLGIAQFRLCRGAASLTARLARKPEGSAEGRRESDDDYLRSP